MMKCDAGVDLTDLLQQEGFGLCLTGLSAAQSERDAIVAHVDGLGVHESTFITAPSTSYGYRSLLYREHMNAAPRPWVTTAFMCSVRLDVHIPLHTVVGDYRARPVAIMDDPGSDR